MKVSKKVPCCDVKKTYNKLYESPSSEGQRGDEGVRKSTVPDKIAIIQIRQARV